MRPLLQVICVTLMSMWLCQSSPSSVPTRTTLPAGELAWVALGDDVLAAVWADGAVGTYELKSGKSRSFFRLSHFLFRDADFAISPGPSPVLACLIARGRDTECSFYDIQSGQCQNTIRIEKSSPIDTVGFSATGRSFFCSSSSNNAIFRISMATRQVSRYSREGNPLFLPQYSSDGKGYVNFYPDGSASGRNWKGDSLWSLDKAYPLQCATLAPSPVLFLTNSIGRDVRAVNVADGKEIWRDGWMDGKHILACAPDGRQLALWDGGQLQLVGLDRTRKKLGQASKKTEACFSPNSQLLLYLPSLEITGDDQQHRPLLQRTSSLACLVDCRNGNVIKRFSLKQPEVVPPAEPATPTKPAAKEHVAPAPSQPTTAPPSEPAKPSRRHSQPTSPPPADAID